MADHRELTFERATAMNISITSAHRPFRRTKISPHDINQRLAKRGTSRLIANQRREEIAFALVQKHPARGADCFLPFAEINAADDHAAAIQTREFLLEHARRQHPTER